MQIIIVLAVNHITWIAKLHLYSHNLIEALESESEKMEFFSQLYHKTSHVRLLFFVQKATTQFYRKIMNLTTVCFFLQSFKTLKRERIKYRVDLRKNQSQIQFALGNNPHTLANLSRKEKKKKFYLRSKNLGVDARLSFIVILLFFFFFFIPFF